LPGKGQLILTGMLGNVMKESVRAALTYARSRGYGADLDFDKLDFHIHLPEGAVPKDGPSAGSVITTALTSLLTGLPVKKRLAMTGEVTITGRVLPVGGIKEKFLAAYREGVKTILYPHTNEKDVSEIPERVRKELTLIPVKHIDEVLPLALEGWKDFTVKTEKTSAKKTTPKKAVKTTKKQVKKSIVKKAVKPSKKIVTKKVVSKKTASKKVSVKKTPKTTGKKSGIVFGKKSGVKKITKKRK
jgi:ATP-dependent Lon protease